MHPACFVEAIVNSHPIEDVKEARGVLIEYDFKVSLVSGVTKVYRAPFNVELPVRRGARN